MALKKINLSFRENERNQQHVTGSRNKKKAWAENGVEDWNSYMAAKKGKLEEQFEQQAKDEFQDATSLFSGIAIFVNGYTDPCADELKRLMMAHGGIYHHYMRSKVTTHIIASNLPYSKIVMYRKSQNPLPICKPEWITDSLKAHKLLDWRPYVLYSNCTKTQPQLQFPGKISDSLIFVTTAKTKETSNPTIRGDVNVTTKESASTSTVNVKNDGKPSSSITKTNNGPISTKNSEFLSEFYNNSRLHHISTMGATFKDYVNELRTKSDGSFPGLSRLKTLAESKNSCAVIKDESDSDEDLFESPQIAVANVEKANEPVIMHIDMDCFFVSVGLRNRPELRGFPVAVTHAKGNRQSAKTSSKNGENVNEEYSSMSEVASCSYEARDAGVKNGMFLGQALKLCPNLKTIQYDFEGYKEVSYTLYDTVASYTLSIEAVSCDEMYADVTNVLGQSHLAPLELASVIRDEIREKTGCPVSTGFGCNKLQARLATRKAKPDGQFHLESSQFKMYIGSMVVRDLPGVGYTTMQLLNKMNVRTCSDLNDISLGVLQKEFGKKTGEILHNMCRGIDNSKLTVERVRKSVSAEVNYGIRFENGSEAKHFLRQLSREVGDRLSKANAKGRSVTLKLMVRAKDAPKEAIKFMGHGICDNFTKSKNLIAPIDDPVVITREVISLWNQMQQPYEDIRGIGIQISRLESLTKRSGIANMMKFISKSKQSDVETTSATLRTSNDEVILSSVMSDLPRSFNNEKSVGSSVEAKEVKPGGLKAFLLPKAQLSTNRNNFTNHNPKVSLEMMKIDDIDELILAELPEDIKQEILEFRGNRCMNYPERQPSTSATCTIIRGPSQCDPASNNGEKSLNPRSSTHPEQIPPRANIDQSILNELPEDIRNEILASTKIEKSLTQQESKKTSKSSQTLQEKYFKHAKSTSGKCGKAQIPPIKDIDMAVLIELPEDIRNEIINEYKANKQADNKKNDTETTEGSKCAATNEREINRINDERTIQDVANVSFSQIDPEFLAALSEDMKTDVEMYCMVKKKEKLKKLAEANSAVNNEMETNRNPTRLSKKNVRLPKSKRTTNNGKSLNDRRNVQKSPERTKNIETVKTDGKLQDDENRKNGRFLESEYSIEGQSGSLEQREEIISHHSSFIGNRAKTDEQEMLTSLVNYLFTLPREQVKMQIRTWISNSDNVNEIDLLSLATFLSMLPKKKRLEDLHILLKTMHRCIMKTGSCVWHETYRRTVYHVQRYMQIEYKSNMMLPKIECDLHKCKSPLS